MNTTVSKHLESIQQGNYKAYLPLYHLFFKELYSFVFLLNNGDAAISKKLTNQTFSMGLDTINDFLENTSDLSFENRIFSLAFMLLSDQTPPSSIGETEKKQSKEIFFSTTLSTLSMLEKSILLLKLWKKISYKEIAAIVGKSEQETKSIFFNSLKNILL